MNDQVAGPGELTCIDDNCAVSGLRQPDRRDACSECGTPLARMPGRIAAQAPPGWAVAPGGRLVPVTAAASAGPSRSPMFRIVVAAAVAALVLLVTFAIRNPDALHRLTGPGFAVGDCVTVEFAGLQGSEMKKADCAGSASLGHPIFQVTQVQKGKNGFCRETTFSNEPENTTYCLVMR